MTWAGPSSSCWEASNFCRFHDRPLRVIAASTSFHREPAVSVAVTCLFSCAVYALQAHSTPSECADLIVTLAILSIARACATLLSASSTQAIHIIIIKTVSACVWTPFHRFSAFYSLFVLEKYTVFGRYTKLTAAMRSSPAERPQRQ